MIIEIDTFPIPTEKGRKHQQLREFLASSITSGQFADGAMLPPEVKLAERLGLSRGTVRKAFEWLVEEGLCTRRRGLGTFVSAGYSNSAAEDASMAAILVQQDVAHSHLLHPFFEEVIRGFVERLNGRAALHICRKDFIAEQAAQAGRFLLLGQHPESFLEIVARLKKPTVSVQYSYRNFPVHCVTSDNHLAGYLAGSHLLELGCREIYVIVNEISSPDFMDRASGVQSALREAGIPLAGRVIDIDSYRAEDAERTILKLLMEKPVDGLIGCRDLAALDALTVLKSMEGGNHVVRVVGVDDSYANAFVVPPLTSVRQPTFQLGKRAAQLLVEEDLQESTVERIAPTLSIRASSRTGISIAAR